VQGSSNQVQGSNNTVGSISEEELQVLQQQMAARLQGKFGNIFSALPTSSHPAPSQATLDPTAAPPPSSASPSAPTQQQE
jgi:hypothetical protein